MLASTAAPPVRICDQSDSRGPASSERSRDVGRAATIVRFPEAWTVGWARRRRSGMHTRPTELPGKLASKPPRVLLRRHFLRLRDVAETGSSHPTKPEVQESR